MIKPLGWLLQPLLASRRNLDEPQTADIVMQRHFAWRRSMLILVLIFTALTAIIDTTAKLINGSRPSFKFVIWLEPETPAPAQSLFGDLGDLAWGLSFYVMPVAALLAAVNWAKPRRSRNILLIGWAASFLVPVAIALTPWDWWSVEPPPAQTYEASLARQYSRITEGLVWGYYYIVVLSPAVLALVPGMMRACISIKRLLPESILPGWFLVMAAPFNSLLVLVVVVALTQIAPSPLLVAGMMLWLAAPLIYLVRASTFTRPLCTSEDLRELSRVQNFVWIMFITSLALLIGYAATWEISGLHLIGFDSRTSLFRPWQIGRFLLNLFGNSFYISVLGTDLLLWVCLSVWQHQREFTQSTRAADYDHLMEQLSVKTS
ncbi:MAG TPA: hypothetical protein PLN21_00850 [Gemmatales bacterium]|nr:hypothetical protein [Gemmatales bacterium]